MVSRRGFSLWELFAVVVVVSLFCMFLFVVYLPAQGHSGSSPNVVAQANLRSFNTGAANYASDNGELIAGFSWSVGSEYVDLGTGESVNPETTGEAWGRQAQNILQRATGRISDEDRMLFTDSVSVLARYQHLPLLDYLTDVQPEPIAASPFDRSLQDWQGDPLSYREGGSGMPNADGIPEEPGWERAGVWGEEAVVQLWPFASSYQVVATAWLDDEDPAYEPRMESPFGMRRLGEVDAALGGRKLHEVAHPDGKVFMYEEFDRFTDPDGVFVGYDDAMVNMAFFDGSVRQYRAGDGTSARDVGDPGRVWRQAYVPMDGFPEPEGGLGEMRLLDLRFRWTVGGLKGMDF